MAVGYNPRIVTDGLVLALDAGNTKSFSPNVFPRGTDIYGWYVDTKGDAAANQSTLSRDTISSPVGNTPLKMEVTGNDPYLRSYNAAAWNLAAASSGDTWTVSFYVKASQSTTGEVLLFESNGTTYFSVPNTTYNITTSWQRISFTATFSNASTTVIQLRLDGPNSGGAGTTVWWDGLQLERGSTASEFTKNYTLDGSLNYRTLDLSGKGNNGTLTNMDGGNLNTSNGGSLSFDGSNDYIALVDNFGDPQQFTIEFWAYPTELNIDGNNNYRRIFIPTGASSNNIHSVLIEQSGNISFRVPGGSGTNMTGSGFSGINEWGHVVCTYDQANKKIYFNGDLKKTTAEASVTVDFGSPQIVDPNAQTFKGNISNFKVYNKALSASEVKQNFNALRGRYGI